MAKSIYMMSANLKARVNGVAEDAKKIQNELQTLTSDFAGYSELSMASSLVIRHAEQLVKYLDKAMASATRR